MNHLLLAVDSFGFPARWLNWQQAATQDALGKIAYGYGDHEFTFRGGTNRLTGVISKITLKSILILRGRCPESFKRSRIPLTNRALFRRDQNICAYCGEHFVSGHGLTREHIVPMSRGGRDTWLNTCACCMRCNLRKSNRTLDELGWELLYVPYEPNHQEGLILDNRRILGDQMELLKAMLPKHSRLILSH